MADQLGHIAVADSGQLSRIIRADADQEHPWEPGELAAILRHQLSVPLALDLGAVASDALPELAGGRITWSVTFGALLQHPDPPLEMLKQVKGFAKSSRQAGGSLPPEVATVLYFASITAALVHARQRISELDQAGLRRGMEWVLSQAWVDQAVHCLMNEGMKLMEQETGNE
jgi:hypothetical protein